MGFETRFETKTKFRDSISSFYTENSQKWAVLAFAWGFRCRLAIWSSNVQNFLKKSCQV